MDQETQKQIQELLSQLRDVHVPEHSWWPPAPGWWIVALLLLACIAFVGVKVLRHKRQFRWIALAEAELNDLVSAFDRHEVDGQTTVKRLSVLMRRSAMAALGRERVARATDENWIQVISDVGKGRFTRNAAELLQSAPYRSQPPSDEQVVVLLQSCRAWLISARNHKWGQHA